jgi:thiosulfate/3-mercaptopyruvate sulfurtransferase
LQEEQMTIDLSALPGPLVSAEWLHECLGEPGIRVVDMRGLVLPPTDPKPWYFGKREAYLAGHIPGAVYLDWTVDIVDPDDSVPVQVAPPARFKAVMEQVGIGDDTLVVAYDDAFSMFAGRLWWALRYYGHEAVRVLDGGWKRWQALGYPSEAGELTVESGATFTPRPNRALRRTVEQVEAGLGSCTLIDARKQAEFVGEESRAARGGHIPGASNLFYQRLVGGPDQTFSPPEAIAALFREAGIDPSSGEIVSYCNGGVSATPVLLGLAVLGNSEAALYDGSWNEWGERADLPLER